jgi:hypothetical protein
VVDRPCLDQFVFVKCGPTAGGIPLYLLDGFQDVFKADSIIPHKGTASANILSRTRARSPSSATTSTGVPKTSSRSMSRPPRSERLRPGSRSTRKSTSLCKSLSPRATEPNTRTLRAPCRAATSRTESRRDPRNSCKVIPLPLCHFAGQPGPLTFADPAVQTWVRRASWRDPQRTFGWYAPVFETEDAPHPERGSAYRNGRHSPRWENGWPCRSKTPPMLRLPHASALRVQPHRQAAFRAALRTDCAGVAVALRSAWKARRAA